MSDYKWEMPIGDKLAGYDYTPPESERQKIINDYDAALKKAAREIESLQTQLAKEKARVEVLERENEELEAALNVIASPRRWSKGMMEAWHGAIPDTAEAFKRLVNEAFKSRA